MNKFEKVYCVLFPSYLLVYFVAVLTKPIENDNLSLAFHVVNYALGIGYLVILIRDVLKRHFPHPNAKVMWTVGFFVFWPVSIGYLLLYGFKPRLRR